jgi:pimeloyl-ACP methyl ester carboxylesterase
LATTVIAGPAPYVEAADLRAWYEHDEDNQLALAGDVEALCQRCEQFGAEHAHDQAEDIPGWFSCDVDKAVLPGEYAEWMAAYVSSAFAVGGGGLCDDSVAFMRQWGFDVKEARNVSVWHGDLDQNVPVDHGRWLATRIPGAELHVLKEEGHMSIGLHMADIVNNLLAKTGRNRFGER